MQEVDRYVEEVIQRGDEGSALLAAICAPTLTNCEYVNVLREGMNGLAVLRLPDGYNAAVFSAHGDSRATDPEEHAASMVRNISAFAREEGINVVGFADMIDANRVEKDQGLVRKLGNAMATEANKHGYAIMNGELALLGDRVNCGANVSGTAVGLVRAGPGLYAVDDRWVCVFDPEGDDVYVNSDGQGTKAEFHERRREHWLALQDSLVMKADDTAKIGARIRAMFDVVERSGRVDEEMFERYADELSRKYGFAYVAEQHDVGSRLRGWAPGETAINVGGSAVSTIDGKRLASLPAPRAGNYLVAARGRPTPRSNGITDQRAAMISMLGERWHETPEGKYFLEFLSEPSTCFYPAFMELLGSGVATAVFHNSGGAFDGKLAKPLAKHGLYALIEGLFEPDSRALRIAEFMGTPPEKCYAKWPMGTEAFVTTNEPQKAIRVFAKYGLEAKVAGMVEHAYAGRTGVELADVRASSGGNVYFPGK